MAPTFLNNVDDVPVETQLILLEIPLTAPDNINNIINIKRNDKKKDDKKGRSPNKLLEEEEDTADRLSKLFSDKSFSQKKYAVIAPLIDFDRGFRTTFFGGKEGGLPAGKGVLAARIESGKRACAEKNREILSDSMKYCDSTFRSSSQFVRSSFCCFRFP